MATSDSIEKETTFTPGPYEDHNESSFAGGISYRTIVAAARNDRAGDYWETICLLPRFDNPQTMANARLLTAVTDLFDALAEIELQWLPYSDADLERFARMHPDDGGEVQPHWAEKILAARRALRKARGEDRSHEGK